MEVERDHAPVSGARKEFLMPRIVAVVLAFVSFAATLFAAQASKILEKAFPFPSPIQWRFPNPDVEVSLIDAAWGPANSLEMISKGREKLPSEGRETLPSEKPAFLPDRPYVLALKFQAKLSGHFLTQMSTCSTLVRISDVNGSYEAPTMLTSSGLVPIPGTIAGAYDIHFSRNNTTEFWDFFPASPDQKEFLFQATPGGAQVSFRVILKDNDLAIVNASPGAKRQCPDFTKSFSGTVGSNAQVSLQLTANRTTLSGTEQYVRIGKTLWLTGQIDSFGNFVLEERYPRDRLTGIFKGRFSLGCQTMSGYFSKPDGSRLLPFEFQEPQSTE